MGDALTLNVADLLKDPGKPRRVHIEDDSLALDKDLAVLRTPIGADLQVVALDEASVMVSGTLSAEFVATCSRCLEEGAGRLSVQVEEIYERQPEDDEAGYKLADESIDLRSLITDGVVLELPDHPLCRDGCAGLCPTCGINRNEATCDCVSDIGDARWDALRNIKQMFEA